MFKIIRNTNSELNYFKQLKIRNLKRSEFIVYITSFILGRKWLIKWRLKEELQYITISQVKKQQNK